MSEIGVANGLKDLIDWKSFIIGSSWLVVAHFFLSVQKIDEDIRNYSYETYTIVAPLYLGLMNVLGGYLFPGPNRYLWTGLVSGIIVSLFATKFKSYNFNDEHWMSYYGYIIVKHLVTFYVIIQGLTQLVA